jgi:hypothetical protein
MKKTALSVAALAFYLLLPSSAPADTVNIPEDEPAISLDIPASWKPEVTGLFPRMRGAPADPLSLQVTFEYAPLRHDKPQR